MTGNPQLEQVQDATWEIVDSFRETNQAVADSLVAIQDRNLKFAQSLFLNWTEVFTYQTKSAQRLQQQWEQQIQRQQDAFQKLVSASMRIYMDFFLTPFSFSRRLVDATETALSREREEDR